MGSVVAKSLSGMPQEGGRGREKERESGRVLYTLHDVFLGAVN